MWGNRQGWLLAAALVAVVAIALGLITRGPGIAKPTEWSADPAHFQPLELPRLGTHLPLPRDQENAIDLTPADRNPAFRAAINDVLKNRALYEDFAAGGDLKSPKRQQLQAAEDIVAATRSHHGWLFLPHPEQVINYEQTKPPLEALELLGRVMVDRLALLGEKAGDHDAAARYAGSAFALGQMLCTERVCYAEFDLGMQLLGKSTPLLARVAEAKGDAAGAAALRDFDARRVQFVKEQIEPVARFVRTIDPKTIGRRTGDVFELARRSDERMWRVEAILALGRVRFLAGEGGTAATQRAATRLVTELAASDPDPAIRAAAAAARDLTVEQHRMQ